MGYLKKATDLYKKCLEIQTKHLGEYHNQTATTMMNLGILYMNMGLTEESL